MAWFIVSACKLGIRVAMIFLDTLSTAATIKPERKYIVSTSQIENFFLAPSDIFLSEGKYFFLI